MDGAVFEIVSGRQAGDRTEKAEENDTVRGDEKEKTGGRLG